MFNWLRKKNYSIYMLQEVHCRRKTQFLYGLPNGVIKPFLVVAPVLEEELLFYSIIISTSNSNDHTRTQMEDLSFATS